MAKILVCDDDKDIVEAIDIYLTQEGYEVLKAYDGDEAIKVLKSNEVDLLIMDVMMPRLDGIRATLKIRENMSLPIIILSAKSEDADKILGLNIGADDYMTKPFNPLELVARVKSQLRRYTQLGSTARSDNQSEFRTGGLVIRDDLKEVTVDGEKVKLNTIYYCYSLKIRERCSLSIRFTKISGMKKRSERTIPLPYISAISGRKSKSIRKSHVT